MVILIKTGVKNSSSQVRLDIRSDGGGEPLVLRQLQSSYLS